ncbi:hypothetical protein PINS_up023389 [Pythium insidiosum]|nr:hypothetical protein PINS_up006723 [Pythium insidiosum]GLE11081.1 hypothetical protein PINS_up023389 [Pythium insidiosum]
MQPSTTAATPPPVLGVTFDLDDTLWCGKRLIRRASDAFHAFIAERSPALAAAYPQKEFHRVMAQVQQTAPQQAHDYTYVRKQALRECITALGGPAACALPSDLEPFLEDAFQAFVVPRSQPELFDGVEAMLHALDERLREAQALYRQQQQQQALSDSVAVDDNGDVDAVRMGVITNGNCLAELLPPVFAQRFPFFLAAEQVGIAKPAAAIFDAAVARFPAWLPRDALVHVGDHYDCDVTGAKQAGLRTIWVHAKWPKNDVLHRDEMDAEDAARFPAADAIVRDVSTVLLVVTRWTQDAQRQRA